MTDINAAAFRNAYIEGFQQLTVGFIRLYVGQSKEAGKELTKLQLLAALIIKVTQNKRKVSCILYQSA